MPQVAVDR